jgi:phosphoribosylformimino-5-aminoimidazole carboxamide ribonucleotide (ProFAR) isomerase
MLIMTYFIFVVPSGSKQIPKFQLGAAFDQRLIINNCLVVLGTAAVPEVLSQLPKSRVVAALDCVHGEVVVKGWTTKTGQNVFDRIKDLKQYVGGFLVTFVEREGRMQGIDLNTVKQLGTALINCITKLT